MMHRISVCTSCQVGEGGARPGPDLIADLRAALAHEDTGAFEVAGVACMAGCAHPCTVAYHGTGKATYLFGGIDARGDLDDLIAFAKDYAFLADGWCSSSDRPGKLRKAALARVPGLPVSA